jgi:hypothetical protein
MRPAIRCDRRSHGTRAEANVRRLWRPGLQQMQRLQV